MSNLRRWLLTEWVAIWGGRRPTPTSSTPLLPTLSHLIPNFTNPHPTTTTPQPHHPHTTPGVGVFGRNARTPFSKNSVLLKWKNYALSRCQTSANATEYRNRILLSISYPYLLRDPRQIWWEDAGEGETNARVEKTPTFFYARSKNGLEKSFYTLFEGLNDRHGHGEKYSGPNENLKTIVSYNFQIWTISKQSKRKKVMGLRKS